MLSSACRYEQFVEQQETVHINCGLTPGEFCAQFLIAPAACYREEAVTATCFLAKGGEVDERLRLKLFLPSPLNERFRQRFRKSKEAAVSAQCL